MPRFTFLLVPFLGFSLCGCGTFSDAMCGPVTNHVYYRGVRFDVQAAKEGGPMALMAADIPFSAAADTILVPFLAYHHMSDPSRKNNEPRPDEQQKQVNVLQPNQKQ